MQPLRRQDCNSQRWQTFGRNILAAGDAKMLSARIKVSTSGSREFDKNTRFALASSLTFVAKEIQTATIKKIEGTFTIRNNWDKPSNVLGIRIKPATKETLEAW